MFRFDRKLKFRHPRLQISRARDAFHSSQAKFLLQTRGKPSTWLPRGRLVELCTTAISTLPGKYATNNIAYNIDDLSYNIYYMYHALYIIRRISHATYRKHRTSNISQLTHHNFIISESHDIIIALYPYVFFTMSLYHYPNVTV